MKIKKLSFAILIFLSALQVSAQTIDTLLNIGTYKLHFKVIKGKNTPVLLESGGGLDLKQWDSIGLELHKSLKATIISYDRQGFGQSELDTAHYNILNEIKGLESGLKQLGYSRTPLLLMCHSLGAFYGRLYSSRHSKQVKCVIMLDPRIPSSVDIAFARSTFKSLNRSMFKPEELGLYYVLATMEQNSDFLRTTPFPSNIPVLDIMAEFGPYTSEKDNQRFKADQRRFVKGRNNREMFFAKGSPHNIPLSTPNLVIAEATRFYKEHMFN